MKFDELNTVMSYLALRDKCEHLRGDYSNDFSKNIMPQLEEMIHNNLTMGNELFDFWVEQTKHD